ncbi:probable amino acid permease 7 [Sesamum indicum]|uniref:Probable amino acid permease 7 n=1 Tax=Sesamum indicum TaxID=4182 RepID=A0A6I9UD44_SESIN|nr:probable amino acid permease 7 [Sesamum indicum]
MGGRDRNEPIPLLQLGVISSPAHELPSSSYHSVNSHHERTGTAWTAVAHIITGVIGSGVLSLAWSMAQLGWIWGPVLMVFFASVTLASTFLLCNCYRSPDPDNGPDRNKSYIDAVRQNLGTKSAWICGLLIQLNLYGTGVAYTITTAICMSAIQRSNCYHKHGHDAPCEFGTTQYMLAFGAIEIFMSQIPDLHSMGWLSVLAAIMSFAYSSIGLGLGAAKVIGNNVIEGSIYGVSTSTIIQKVWQVSQAVGDIAFAYPYCIILLEIQDTLKSPPPERETMKKASLISVCITTFFYLSCGGLGYAAFGDQTPGDLLTGFSGYGPYWLINFANACVVLHLIGGYQVYCQPLFAVVDKWLAEQFPQSSFVNREYSVKLPAVPALSLNLQRLCFRTVYVVSTTGVAMVFPYFNQVLGVLGTINFWPLSIYFPVEMWLRQNNIESWTTQWILLRTFGFLCFLLNMYMLAGSIQGILTARFS